MEKGKVLHYGLIFLALTTLSGCSAVEYVQKKNYSVSAAYMALDPVSEKGDGKTSLVKNSVSLLAIKKAPQVKDKSDNTIGKIYLKNSFSSTSNNEMVFELSRNHNGYKASTPIFYQSDKASSGIAFTVNGYRQLMAGVECVIKF